MSAAVSLPAPGVRLLDLDRAAADPTATPGTTAAERALVLALAPLWSERSEPAAPPERAPASPAAMGLGRSPSGIRWAGTAEPQAEPGAAAGAVAAVDAAVDLLEQCYAHLPLKRAMYATDPVQRLRLLRRSAESLPAAAVHRELAAVFAGLHDAHTRYLGPDRFAGCVAALGFFVEEHGEGAGRRYVVTKVARRGWVPAGSPFRPGVEATYWNGTPFARALDQLVPATTGAHVDARRARALESLAFRSLQFEARPAGHWVDLRFRTANGEEHEVRLYWRLFTPARATTTPADPNPAALAMALDHPGREVQAAKADLYAGPGRRRPARTTANAAATNAAGEPVAVDPALAGLVSARRVDSELGPIGYLRLWHFDTPDAGAYVDGVRRLLERLPDRGLVVDVRANPGGLVWAAERILQLLTPQRIEPARFSLPASPLTHALAADDAGGTELGPWHASLDEAVATGELYSLPLPLTSAELCNDIGQVYGGPVVAVADARTYSAGDLFAAGFADNGVGTLITVGGATGGGGANVWTWPLLHARLTRAGATVARLPDGCGLTLAFRRATRARASEGRPIEDVGVPGHVRHAMTRRDVLGGNRDLLAAAAEVLAAQRHTRLHVQGGRRGRGLRVRAQGLDRLRVTVDDVDTATVVLARSTAEVPLPERWETVEVEGIGAGQVLQRRRLRSG